MLDILREIADYHDMRDIPRLPFGYVNDWWEEFKGEIQDGDLIYYFTSDELSWRALCGIEGYALIRGGEVVTILVTAIS